MSLTVCIRGGGDLGSGVGLRLYRSGMQVVICELTQPLVVRRSVAFAEAIFSGSITVEGVIGKKAFSQAEIEQGFNQQVIPVVADPDLDLLSWLKADVIVDARLLKKPVDGMTGSNPLIIGLGPGFTAGLNCHAVVETKRGQNLGRVSWQGSGEPNSGIPEMVLGYVEERVIRAPSDGVFHGLVKIGQQVGKGHKLAEVSGLAVTAAFDGVVRGLLADGVTVSSGMKVGDLDPRMDVTLTQFVSDKALAVGGGVLEAILSRPEFREKLSW
ncbi:MAG TPA: selenium-dependent molybdenum cofactor biosynthesis protein YqeB [Bellilinea sp.]|nr:selenium-dependent molybdenum cofactor biosynthesis protein YqeB [Bellilinea sp.]